MERQEEESGTTSSPPSKLGGDDVPEDDSPARSNFAPVDRRELPIGDGPRALAGACGIPSLLRTRLGRNAPLLYGGEVTNGCSSTRQRHFVATQNARSGRSSSDVPAVRQTAGYWTRPPCSRARVPGGVVGGDRARSTEAVPRTSGEVARGTWFKAVVIRTRKRRGLSESPPSPFSPCPHG